MLVFCPLLNLDRDVFCGVPESPRDGSLGSYLPSSPQGTTVTFQCNDGLFPSSTVLAVCDELGEWRPNPADHSCSPRPGRVMQ